MPRISKKSKVRKSKVNTEAGFWVSNCIGSVRQWCRASWWHKIALVLLAFVILFTTFSYSVAQWYRFTQRDKPVVLGATFISDYASYLGVEPRETMYAVINELGVKNLRLVSYWDKIEANRGKYDFSDLDWQFKMAEENNVKISLALGLRQPRWPECHMPDWAKQLPAPEWYGPLEIFIQTVVERYRSSPALESYQLENEYFLQAFGICSDFNRDRLVSETNLVKRLDPTRTLIITRSNNGLGFPIGKPTPDLFGVSVYKRVWDKTVTKRYFEYPLPAWFYGSLAGGGKILTGKDLFIHELQTESWTPEGFETKTAPIEELYKSMNSERLVDRVEYAKASGMKRIDMWGVEWWYQMKQLRGQPELWDTARGIYTQTAADNAKLAQ